MKLKNKNHIFKYSIVVLLPVIILIGLFFFHIQPVRAATSYTVCGSLGPGCDFTTITDAFSSVGLASGDTILIDPTYDPTTETYPLSFPSTVTDITLDCQNNSVSGNLTSNPLPPPDQFPSVINLDAGSTIQNCQLSDVDIQGTKANETITNNEFHNAAATGLPSPPYITTLSLTGATNFSITSNTDIGRLTINSCDAGMVSDNSISVYNEIDNPFGLVINNSSNVNVISNMIANHIGWPGSFGGNLSLVGIDSSTDLQFDSNNLDLSDDTSCNHCGAMQVGSGDSISITGNYIPLVKGNSDLHAIRIQPQSGDFANGTIEHNTFYIQSGSGGGNLIDIYNSGNDNISADTDYNLFYNFGGSANGTGIQAVNAGSGNVTINNDYNGFWNLSSNTFNVTLGAHSKTTNPLLKLGDANPNNNLELVPFSNYLDVNGAQDIGAFSAVRRSTININAAGPVDYASVDGLDVSSIADGIRDGDTVNVAAGTYAPFTIMQTADNTGAFTLTGAGASTIINSTGAENSITWNGLNGSTISNIKAQGANISSTAYTITKALWKYNGNTYDQSGNLGGSPPDSAIVFQNASCGIPQFINSDGVDVSTAVGAGTDNWNLGLVDLGPGFAKITVYIPSRFLVDDSYTVDSIGLQNYILNQCGSPSTIDKFIPNIFTANGGGTYSYNASAASAASAILKVGETDPPHLDRTTLSYAGIEFVNANNNLVSNVISTNNGYGVWFSGTSNNNTLNGNTLTGNVLKNIMSDSSGDNNIQDSTLDIPNLQVNGSGKLKIYYTVKATVQSANGSSPVENASVLIKNNSGIIAGGSPLLTDVTGMTPFSSLILATSIGNGDPPQVTSGGLNPFSINVVPPLLPIPLLSQTITRNIDTPFQNILFSLSTSNPPTYIPMPVPIIPVIPPSETPPSIPPITPPTEIPPSGEVSKPIANSNMLSEVQASPIPPFDLNWGLPDRVNWALQHRENIYNLYVNYLSRQPSIAEVNWWLQTEPNINIIKEDILKSGEYLKDNPNIKYNIYTVRSGDSLESIAQTVYGDSNLWTKLVDLNKDQFPTLIYDPNILYSDWQLKY